MTSARRSADPVPTQSTNFSPAEWDARVELAALYRALHAYGMTDLIYNHITLRVPDAPDTILINPFGMLYKQVTASSFWKIDLDGNIIYRSQDDYELNPAGAVIHTAVHRAREDAHCVLHTHSRASSAVAAMPCGLLPISQHAHMFIDELAYHDFTGPIVTLEQQAKLVADLARFNALVLRNHGLLVCGANVGEAFVAIYWLEAACKIQVDAMAGGELTIPSAEALAASKRVFARRPNDNRGRLEWAAIKRDLDMNDPGYRA